MPVHKTRKHKRRLRRTRGGRMDIFERKRIINIRIEKGKNTWKNNNRMGNRIIKIKS